MSSHLSETQPSRAAALARGAICASLALAHVACERADKTRGAGPAPSAPSESASAQPATPAEPAAPRELPDQPIAGDWTAVCDAVDGADFPAADLPGSEDKAGMRPGDAHRYYYGIGTEVDDVRARHAAFVEREQGDELVVGGSAILMMLYANGRGVKRNLDLAIKLACKVGHAPAEIEGRVSRLNRVKSSPGEQSFDLCDESRAAS